MSWDKIKGIEIPQDNWDKKLSEQERMAWIRFSAQELSDDVLRSLRININGVSKYIKDVVYYNSDVEAIMNNPEELIKLQAFLKKKTGSDVELTWVYDKKTEIAVNEYRKNRNIEWEMFFFQKQNPAFRTLIQKYPTRFEEIKKRALLYNELSKVGLEISPFSDKVKNKEGKNITTIQQILTSNLDNANVFNSSTVSTYIEWWNWPGSINYLWFQSDNVTYVEYIRRLLNKNWLVTELFWNVQKSSEQTLEKSQKEQLSRAKTFMDSLIARNPSLNMDNKKEVDTIYAMIIAWNMSVIDVLNKLTKKELKLTVNLSTKEWLANALRAIWDTATAGTIMHSELKTKLVDMTDTWDTNPEALTRFNNVYTTNHSKLSGDKKSQDIIQKKFNDILASISDDPTSEYYYLMDDIKKQQQMKEWLMALMVFDETMKQTWPEWLWDLASIYNDMKWLNGLLTFSDENAKIWKEVGIMLASIALTAWLSTVLSVAWAGLRAVQVARVAKAVDSANKATRLARIWAWLSGVTWRVAWGWARVFEVSAQAINKINSIPVIGNALVFTSLETWFSKYYHSEWEMVTGLEDFWRSLAANTAMFWVFHWVWKLTGKLITKFWVQGAFKQFWILSAWDVWWMYILHLIETGKYSPAKEEWAMIATQAFWYRGLMKWMEKMYPKVAAWVKAYFEKQNIVAEWAWKQEMKAITANAGKSKIEILDEIKIKENKLTEDMKWMKDWSEELQKARKELRQLQKERKVFERENKTLSKIDTAEVLNKNLETLKSEYEQINNQIKQRVRQMKVNRATGLRWINSKIRLELKELGIERRRIRSEIKKLTPNEKTYTWRMEAIDSAVKTEKDLKINEYQKEIEKVDKELVRLNSEKVTIESDLSNIKNQYEELKKKNPERAEKLKGTLEERTKLNQERLEQIEVSIKEQEWKLKDLNSKIDQLKTEKKVLIDEKNKVASWEEQIEIKAIEWNKSKLPVVIQEVPWKSKKQAVKDWLKDNKKAIIWTILAVWGVWGATYYILQKDSLWDTIPVIYIPDDDEDKNNKQDWLPKIPDEWESSEWQGWKQDWSTEGNSQWVTPVVPSGPNKWWESHKWSSKKPAEEPKISGKSWSQSAGATIWAGSSTNLIWDSKPEWGQNTGNLQEQIKAKQVSLMGDLQNIYKNRYQNLKDIGLWDAFFGLDKGVEMDENPIYLDYDGTINGRIIVNSKWEYQITLDNKKAIAWYTANAVITWSDLFETLTKGFTIWNEINKAEVKAYRAAVDKEEERKRMYS